MSKTTEKDSALKSQRERFVEAAKQSGFEDDRIAFDEALRRISTAKPPIGGEKPIQTKIKPGK
ncbi:MAG: hypothetical protein ACKVOI_06145 [Dongiaceae bacterium]